MIHRLLHRYQPISVLMFGVSLLGLVTPSVLAQSQPSANPASPQGSLLTTFYCVVADNRYATIAKRGNRTTPPMITWQDTSFGSQYTPERRCQIVSDRLTQAVAQNGGKLIDLSLTYGSVNGFPVICYVRRQAEQCSSDNLLLTLRQDDRGRESLVLQQILAFGVTGNSAPLTRGGGNTPPEPIAFGTEVERSLSSYAITPGALPSALGTFQQEVERSFGIGATPVIPRQPSATPQPSAAGQPI